MMVVVSPPAPPTVPEYESKWTAFFSAAAYDQFELQRGLNLAFSYDIVPTVPVVIGDDVATCADPLRAYSALYIGGMGSRDKNFYNQLVSRMGYEQAAAEVQDLYLDRKQGEAMAAVPLDFIDKTSLIGPPERIKERLHAYDDAGVSTLTIASYAGDLETRLSTVRQMAELVDQAGLA